MNVAGTLNVVTAAREILDICGRVVAIVGGRVDAAETLRDLPLRNAYFRSAKHGVG